MRGDETSKELNSPTTELVALARTELGEMSIRRRAEGFAMLHSRRSPSKRRTHLLLGFAAALTALGLVLIGRFWLDLRDRSALSYTVEGGRIEPGGAVEPNGATEPTLRFSDGTEVVFLAGARGLVRSVDEHGARVGLTGKAKIAVVPWAGSHWLFDVGPFLITVKGTAFTAEWKNTEDRLEVVLETGNLAVSGPMGDEPITLRAGQQLTISMREKQVIIRSIEVQRLHGAARARPTAKEDLRRFESGPRGAVARSLSRAP